MNCPNCGRPMSACQSDPCGQTSATSNEERKTLALESIAESLRNLPSKRELLAAIIGSGTEPHPAWVKGAIGDADAIIAACKETQTANILPMTQQPPFTIEGDYK